jgi:hypothetical protein
LQVGCREEEIKQEEHYPNDDVEQDEQPVVALVVFR